MTTCHHLIILFLIAVPLQACHYTCSTCQADAYSECLTCPDNQPLYQPFPGNSDIGSCTYVSLSNINAAGIVVAFLLGLACLLLRCEEPFYYLFTLQTIGLTYFVQIRWVRPLDYLLNALTYLMPLSASLRYSKQPDHSLTEKSFRAAHWFRTASLPPNIALAGLSSLVLILLIIIVPLFKVVRRCLNPDRHQCFPQWLLQKVQTVASVLFLMLIQQCMLAIGYGLGFGTVDSEVIVITVFYVLSVLVFTVNLLFDPLPIFRNRGVQLNTILCKLICPLFIAGSAGAHFILFILLFMFTLIQLALTHTNKNSQQCNRMFYYRVMAVVFSLTITVAYLLQYQLTQQQPTNITGIISFCLLVFFMFCFNLQVFIIIQTKCWLQPQNNNSPSKEKTEEALATQPKGGIEDTWDQVNANQLRLDQGQNSANNQPTINIVALGVKPQPYIVSDEQFQESQDSREVQYVASLPGQPATLEPIKINQRKNKLPALESPLKKAQHTPKLNDQEEESQEHSQPSSCQVPPAELQRDTEVLHCEVQDMGESNLPFHNRGSRPRRRHRKK